MKRTLAFAVAGATVGAGVMLLGVALSLGWESLSLRVMVAGLAILVAGTLLTGWAMGWWSFRRRRP